jgi:hypothetical protein
MFPDSSLLLPSEAIVTVTELEAGKGANSYDKNSVYKVNLYKVKRLPEQCKSFAFYSRWTKFWLF